MLPPVSVRQFAKLDGCSHTLVQKAIREGKLTVTPDGKIDPELAGSGWRKQNRRGNPGAETAKVATPVPKVAAPKQPVAAKVATPRRRSQREAEPTEEPTLDPAGLPDEDFVAEVLAGRFRLVGHAEMVKENALAAKNLLAARKEAGDVVDLEVAEAVLFEVARMSRDAWLNWPARVGPLIAADLGVQPDPVVEALNKYVQQQLQDLGEPDPDFTGTE